jgi:hypothetical protein
LGARAVRDGMHLLLPFAAVVLGGNLVNLLVTLLVIALVIWLLFWVIGQMGLPAPMNLVARVIVGVIAILVLLDCLGAFGGQPLVLIHS